MNAPQCRRCRCSRTAHKPYFPGSNKPGYCVGCHCWQFLPWRPWSRLVAWFRQRPEPVRADVLHPRPVRLPITDSPLDEFDQRTRLDIRIARPYASGGSRPPWESR